MRNHSTFTRRFLTVMLVMIMTVFFTLPVRAAVTKTVTVGYYFRENFQEGCNDSYRKSGYAYEYLQKIASYTGWKYEYVYGSYDELVSSMEEGNIDLIAGISESDGAPDNTVLADQPLASLTSYIYRHTSDVSLTDGKPEDLEGHTVGVIRNDVSQTFLESFIHEHDISCTVLPYENEAALMHAYRTYDIDCFAMADMDISEKSDVIPCIELGSDRLFAAVAQHETEVLEDLNRADSRLREDSPYYLVRLFASCFQTAGTGTAPSAEENAWLATHDTLTIGYLNNYMPYCDTDEKGNLTGFLKDYIATLREEIPYADLTVQTVPYDSLSEAYEDLKAGKINAAFPFCEDIWYADRLNIRNSTIVYTQSIDLIFEGNYSDDLLDSIVLSATDSVLASYIEQYYPFARVTMMESYADCLDAISKGEAAATVVNHFKAEQYLNRQSWQSLHSLILPASCGICFTVRGTDVELLSLINRVVRVMGDESIASSINRYLNYDTEYTVQDFLMNHLRETVLTVTCIVLFLILMFGFYIYTLNRRKEELRKAKDELSDALEKAEAANEAKTSFLFNMSHDIRTPMNAILGYTDLLEQDGHNTPVQKQYLENIRTTGGYLLDLINEVLEMSRIESGKVTLNYVPCDYRALIDEISVVMAASFEKKQLTYIQDIRPEHPYVNADTVKEKTIYLNIISNAIKYTPEGGTVTLTVSDSAGNTPDEVMYHITLRDTGVGMSEEFLPHIFDSFSREKTATQSKIQGSGLGMGIVRKYTELMGGTIRVESRLNEGTVITIDIPHTIADASKAATIHTAVDDTLLHNRHVLLAEDNELNMEIASEILKREGMSVTPVTDGRQCVDTLFSHPAGTFDFILMDVQMPVLDGLEATEEIRSHINDSRSLIPIVALTANAFDTDRQAALQSGMNGFVPKPIRIEELKKELVQVLEHKGDNA